jgi:hypothetical protein
MKIELFALCDFAQAEPTGKLNLLGIFDHLYAREAPVLRSVFAIAARIRFESHEEGPKTLTMTLVDSDGTRVLPQMRAQFPVKIQPAETNATLNYAMVIPQAKFPRFGDYQVDLAVDDKIEASLPLYVRQHPATLPPA